MKKPVSTLKIFVVNKVKGLKNHKQKTGGIMQEQYTVRLYDVRQIAKLENLYKKCKDIYSSKNPFFVDCIIRGAEAIDKDLFGTGKPDSVSGLYDEINLTMQKLDNLLKLCEKSSRETLANLKINQKLLSCNYNVLLGLSEDEPVKRDFVEGGMYDELPDRLSEILEELLEHFLNK